MALITESFGNLSDYLQSEYRKSRQPAATSHLLISQLLSPILPSGIRCGTGTIIDTREREVGPFDVIGSLDNYPAFGQGGASLFVSEGVLFILQARNWAEHDLTQFNEIAGHLKALQRVRTPAIECIAISFEPLALSEVQSFMGSPSGKNVDGILSLGQHIVIRNKNGIYGDPDRTPFVTENPGPAALKALAFHLMHLSQTATKQSFGLAEYQHL